MLSLIAVPFNLFGDTLNTVKPSFDSSRAICFVKMYAAPFDALYAAEHLIGTCAALETMLRIVPLFRFK
jgi:hypothetical protein